MNDLADWIRGRTIGQLTALGILGIAAMALLIGAGYSSSRVELQTGSTWLPNEEDGEIAHVAGPAAEVDFRIQLADDGDKLSVAESEVGLFVLNRSSGTLMRVDPGTYTVEDQEDLERTTAETFLRVGRDVVYAIHADGTVDVLGATDLRRTASHDVSGSLPSAEVDGKGSLWVTSSESGELIEIDERRVKSRVAIADAGDELAVTIGAGGRPGVLNRSTRTWSQPQGAMSVELPDKAGSNVQVAAAGEWSTPSFASDGAWVSFDSTNGKTKIQSSVVDGQASSRPIIDDERVYIADPADGSLAVLAADDGALLHDPIVREGGGWYRPVVRDRFVLASASQSSTGWVVDPDGDVVELDLSSPEAIQFNSKGEDITPASTTSGDGSDTEGEDDEARSETRVREVESDEVEPTPDRNPEQTGTGDDGDSSGDGGDVPVDDSDGPGNDGSGDGPAETCPEAPQATDPDCPGYDRCLLLPPGPQDDEPGCPRYNACLNLDRPQSTHPDCTDTYVDEACIGLPSPQFEQADCPGYQDPICETLTYPQATHPNCGDTYEFCASFDAPQDTHSDCVDTYDECLNVPPGPQSTHPNCDDYEPPDVCGDLSVPQSDNPDCDNYVPPECINLPNPQGTNPDCDNYDECAGLPVPQSDNPDCDNHVPPECLDLPDPQSTDPHCPDYVPPGF